MTTPSASLSDYNGSQAGGATLGNDDSDQDKTEYWSHQKCRRAYLDYLESKKDEISEQQEIRRFVHGEHWTSAELAELKARKQPAVYENIAIRKVRGIVGTLERLKQDPKAYPRTPKHEKGAELATAVVNYALDATNFSSKDPVCSSSAAIDGIGGVEFNLVQGDQGDAEIDIDVVDVENFFYDPRSFRLDFSDARYLGVGKWFDLDAAIELFPEHEDALNEVGDDDSELTSDSDRETQWYSSDDDRPYVRIVEIWYQHKSKWCWALFTGDSILEEGESYLKDHKKRPTHKYEMFSAYVDHEGDRYGIVRDIKPLNREMNMRRSKALYTMMSRRIIAAQGAFDDIEVARREAARSDGVVLYNPLGDSKPEFDDAARSAESEAQFKFYESLRTSIENFGPNVAVLGQGLENSSGRAINMLQQAGMADLGPFMQSYRGWKIRIYRKLWCAIQHHWSAQRWIRVTDDDDLSQFIEVNGIGIDPMTGQPTLVNSLGNLDVDIILDEGPDEVNAAGDAYDTLTVLSKNSGIPPEMIKPWFQMLLELAPLPGSLKSRLKEILNPEPTPEDQQKQQLQMRGAVAEVEQIESDVQLKQAQAYKAKRDGDVAGQESGDGTVEQGEHPMTIQAEAMEKMAAAKQKEADAQKKLAEIKQILQEIELAPMELQLQMQADQRKADMDQQRVTADIQMAREDRYAQQQQAAQDRSFQAQQSDRQMQQQRVDSDRNYKVNMKKASRKPASPKGKK